MIALVTTSLYKMQGLLCEVFKEVLDSKVTTDAHRKGIAFRMVNYYSRFKLHLILFNGNLSYSSYMLRADLLQRILQIYLY